MASLEQTTTEVEIRVLKDIQKRVPELQRFCNDFSLNIRVPVIDRYSANIKAEKVLLSENPGMVTALFPCDVHRQSTCVKNALKVSEATVSGVLNIGLMLEETGSVAKLQQILRDIFLERLEVVFDAPPRGWVEDHRRQLLDLCCPVEHGKGSLELNKKRQLILNHFANSDLTSESIRHYCRFNCCESVQATARYFATFVAWALAPHKPGVLSRKSWTGADVSFSWCTLMSGCWNLLPEVLKRYIGNVDRQLPEPSGHGDGDDDEEIAAVLGLLAAQADAQAAADEGAEDAEPAQGCADPRVEEGAGQSEVDWAALNRARKKKVAAFVSSAALTENLVISLQALMVGLGLLYSGLALADREWETEQMRQVARGMSRSYRVLEAATGQLKQTSWKRLLQRMFLPPLALGPASQCRQPRSHLFRLLSKWVCNTEWSLWKEHRLFPYALFRILNGDAEAVYAMPVCLRDSLAHAFMQRYPTPGDAAQPEARAMLQSLALVAEVDISNIECGHSSIREYTQMRGRGHLPDFAEVSARALCRYVGRWEVPAANVPAAARPEKQRRNGGIWDSSWWFFGALPLSSGGGGC